MSDIPVVRDVSKIGGSLVSSGTSLVRTGTDTVASVIDTGSGFLGTVLGSVIKIPAPVADLVGMGDSIRSAGDYVGEAISDSTKLTVGAALRTAGASIENAGIDVAEGDFLHAGESLVGGVVGTVAAPVAGIYEGTARRIHGTVPLSDTQCYEEALRKYRNNVDLTKVKVSLDPTTLGTHSVGNTIFLSSEDMDTDKITAAVLAQLPNVGKYQQGGGAATVAAAVGRDGVVRLVDNDQAYHANEPAWEHVRAESALERADIETIRALAAETERDAARSDARSAWQVATDLAAKVEEYHQNGLELYEHKIESGDTLTRLAAQYLGNANRWKEIRDLNGLPNDGSIQAGKTIKILMPIADAEKLRLSPKS